MVSQLNHHFSRATVRTCVAVGCNKTYADDGDNLHKFPKQMKDSRLLSVSMLCLSVLFELLDARHPPNSLNFLITKTAANT